METERMNCVGGSLQISTDVIGKIARQAALEVEGIAQVCAQKTGTGLLRSSAKQAVTVVLEDSVAQIALGVQVHYGCRIPAVCEKVQQNVKNAVQNMTSITVARVDVAVLGVESDTEG